MQPTLKHFILRHQVLAMYRLAIRKTQYIPDPQGRRETIKWIRDEFERNKHLRDVQEIQDKLQACRRELKQTLHFTQY
ncbi:hypothetical protein BD410DRAFT_712268 [Rickenella mellea]|uniref:LYR motif-containing protein 2 n=1 Tax=Rickenella mellea TaxID=50990 RepID=A0A4Y7QLY0_9AGAM|nr:hypothetical protein BD410DRAFT_712268 [Rickenella mellea]